MERIATHVHLLDLVDGSGEGGLVGGGAVEQHAEPTGGDERAAPELCPASVAASSAEISPTTAVASGRRSWMRRGDWSSIRPSSAQIATVWSSPP